MKHMLGIFPTNFCVFFLIIFIGYNDVSYAYIDPGTGMFIVQTLIAIGASIIFYLGYPIRLIKSLFSRIFKKKETDKQQNNRKN
jgi:hypothetical protein